MVIPWVGIPLADVLKRFEPTSDAKYVAFTTVMRPEEMPGMRRKVLDWPYRGGLRIDEAMHPLTLLTVGLYGEVLPNQNGAPIRLVVPWKYGFKSIKSIVQDTIQAQKAQDVLEHVRRPRNTGSIPTSIPRWTTRAGARARNAASVSSSSARP